MRIAQVVLSLDVGGQERLLIRMAHALRERGHELHVVSLTPGGALRGDVAPIEIHDVPRKRGFDPTLYTRLFGLFRELQPDVVHTHNTVPLSYAAPAAKLARVRRTVHTKHGHIAHSRSALHLARAATRFVDAFVAVANDTASIARRIEQPPMKRLSVIENGIPLGKFTPDGEARAAIRRELGIASDAVVVGTVGRLVEEKDYPLLVKAMAPRLSAGVRLVIVGEGTMRPAIEAAIAEHVAPENRAFVTLTGQRGDVQRLLCSFDVFALSSHMEGLPLVIPEAMACGLPVVATAVGGIPGIVPKQTGELVPSRDVEALRRALGRFIDDREGRAASGKAARSYALARFAEERMIDRYLALYA